MDTLSDRYLTLARGDDVNTAEDWKAVASDTLTFSGLFSGVVATFLAIVVPDLQPDPQDKPTFYLENIYQLLANPNRTDVPTSPTQSNPPSFSPPRSAIWINSLWSLSLVITLSCALLAILVQQWARRYIKVTQRHSNSSPNERARIRATFHKGVEELHLQLAVDALPVFLHASLVLFLAGLVVFSFHSHHTVFRCVVSWVGLCAVIYAYFTVLPLHQHISPYYTPLSHPLWHFLTFLLYLFALALRWFTAFNCFKKTTSDHFNRCKNHCGNLFSQRIEEVAKERTQEFPLAIDSRILLWALQSLNEDRKVQKLFERIQDFRNSEIFNTFRTAFGTSNREKMVDALLRLMDRTLSSKLSESIKQRQMKIYYAIAEASLPISRRTLDRVLHGDWDRLLDSVEFGHILRDARNGGDPIAEYRSQFVVSVIIARVKKRDDRWFELATGQLGIPGSTLEDYLRYGDSLLLANCIDICQRTLKTYSNGWHGDVYSQSKPLEIVSSFHVQGTHPDMRHKFCMIWNDLVQKKRDPRTRDLSIYILKHIRKLYFELHHDTTAAPIAFDDATPDDDINLLFPSSYLSCQLQVAGHLLPPQPVGGVERSEESSLEVAGHTDHPASPAAPGTSGPRLFPRPDSGAAAEGEGSVTAASHRRRERALDIPLVGLENIMPRPLQSPSPSPVTEGPVAVPSRPRFDVEHTGSHHYPPSRNSYDNV